MYCKIEVFIKNKFMKEGMFTFFTTGFTTTPQHGGLLLSDKACTNTATLFVKKSVKMLKICSKKIRIDAGKHCWKRFFGEIKDVDMFRDPTVHNIKKDISSGRSLISWYPGHIAKAERELAEYLKLVDVVIEVRDARIPIATTHPSVPKWVGNRPLIVAITRLDQVSPKALSEWKVYYSKNPAYFERPDAKVFFVDGRSGDGISALKKYAMTSGRALNEKRLKRGIQPRAVRAAVIGFPNVGKSALINRILNRKVAASRDKAGVTRRLLWVKLGSTATGSQEDAMELLDSPGIIPGGMSLDQDVATKLAICNDIGEASYDRVLVAAAMCDMLNALHVRRGDFVDMAAIVKRYHLPFSELAGDQIVQQLAQKLCKGNATAAADRLLGDFRKGALGFGSLECTTDAPAIRAARAEGTAV
jgi:ribosome biogenesis GTPase A